MIKCRDFSQSWNPYTPYCCSTVKSIFNYILLCRYENMRISMIRWNAEDAHLTCHFSIYLSNYLSIQLSIYPTIYLPFYLFINLFICLVIYLLSSCIWAVSLIFDDFLVTTKMSKCDIVVLPSRYIQSAKILLLPSKCEIIFVTL